MIVEVEWLDAGCETMNLSEDDVVKLHGLARKNVGYLMVDSTEKVILCFGKVEDRDKHGVAWDTTLVIPRGIVTKITELKINE